MKCNGLFVYRTSTHHAIVFECSLKKDHRGLHMAWNHPTDENHFCLSWKKNWSEEKVRTSEGLAGRLPEPGVEGAEATPDPQHLHKNPKEEPMEKIKVGDVVRYKDSSGIGDESFHNALVIHVWETCVNIVFVSPVENFSDAVGNERLYRTSVPWKEKGMSESYVEKIN